MVEMLHASIETATLTPIGIINFIAYRLTRLRLSLPSVP